MPELSVFGNVAPLTDKTLVASLVAIWEALNAERDDFDDFDEGSQVLFTPPPPYVSEPVVGEVGPYSPTGQYDTRRVTVRPAPLPPLPPVPSHPSAHRCQQRPLPVRSRTHSSSPSQVTQRIRIPDSARVLFGRDEDDDEDEVEGEAARAARARGKYKMKTEKDVPTTQVRCTNLP